MIRRTILLLSISLTGLANVKAADIPLYGNLGTVNSTTTANTVGYYNGTLQNQFQSQGFTIGSTAYVLSRIDVGLASTLTPSPVVSIYSDNGNQPGTSLASFTTNSTVSNKQIYSFTGTYTLSPTVQYWIVLSNANSASQASYEWYSNDASTTPSGQNSSGIAYLGSMDRNNVGGTWSPTISSLSIGLYGTAVPEPSTYALALIATGVLAAMARRRKKS